MRDLYSCFSAMEIVVQRNEVLVLELRCTPKSSDPLPSPLPCTLLSRQREVTAPHAGLLGLLMQLSSTLCSWVAAEIQEAPLQLNVAPHNPSFFPLLHPRALTW